MSRPSIRRALRRAGVKSGDPAARPAGARDLGVVPPPRIFLPGEPADAGAVDFGTLFGRSAPVELEIGTGKGRFLLEEAAAHPDRNYLGAEIETGYALIARARAERLGLANVRFERLDGKLFVIRRVPPSSLAALHVYFPDPWPKKRHHKRRLFDAEFAAAAARALAPGAPLSVATDHAPYWQVIEEILASEPALERIPEPEAMRASPGTNYGMKYLKSGRPIFQAIFRRR